MKKKAKDNSLTEIKSDSHNRGEKFLKSYWCDEFKFEIFFIQIYVNMYRECQERGTTAICKKLEALSLLRALFQPVELEIL